MSDGLALARVIGWDFKKPCVGCGAETNNVLRSTDEHLCFPCLQRWLSLRKIGWTGKPADLAGLEWIAIPQSIINTKGN